MTDSKGIIKGLLNRLLAGERGNLPLHLALILEASSPLKNEDQHYDVLLPSTFARVRVDPDTFQETIRIICSELSSNPDAGLLFAVSMTGSDTVTRLVVDLLVSPPRPLTINEVQQMLGILESYLPFALSKNVNFVNSSLQTRLSSVLGQLSSSSDFVIQRHVRNLKKFL